MIIGIVKTIEKAAEIEIVVVVTAVVVEIVIGIEMIRNEIGKENTTRIISTILTRGDIRYSYLVGWYRESIPK